MEPYDADTKLHDKVLGKDGFPFEGTVCFFKRMLRAILLLRRTISTPASEFRTRFI